MADEKLNSNINLGEILYLEVPVIYNTDCKLLHDSELKKKQIQYCAPK